MNASTGTKLEVIVSTIEVTAVRSRNDAGSGPHLPVLDGVRALAIAMVMFFHFFQHGPALGTPLLKALGKVAALGQMGVDLFFVLSGFLITGILLRTRGRPHALRTFYWRRSARIFPLYYAYLAGAFLLFPLLHLSEPVGWGRQWWFWFYLQNVQDTFLRGFQMFGPGHFWSLAVEEHFYLVWPFLVMALPLRRLKAALLAIVGIAIASRALMISAGYPVFYFTLCRMDSLALGSLLAVATREPAQLQQLGAFVRRWGMWLLAGLVPFYGLFTGSGNSFIQVFKFTVFALVFTAAVALALTVKPGGLAYRFLGSRPLAVIARGSYALYVFHPAVFGAWTPLFGRVPIALLAAGSFLSAGLAAWLSWTLLEVRY